MNKIKIIFLDIDGVLNFSDFLYKTDPEWVLNNSNPQLCYMGKEICPSKVLLLNQVVEKIPNLFFVVSSAWRIRTNLQNLQHILNVHKFKGTLLDSTPSFGKRGEEIQEWLNEATKKYEIEKFVILDDEPSGIQILKSYIIEPHPKFWGKGLEQFHIDEIIERLS